MNGNYHKGIHCFYIQACKIYELYVHVYYFHMNVFAQIYMYIENTGKTALCRKIMNNLYLDHINIPVMKNLFNTVFKYHFYKSSCNTPFL